MCINCKLISNASIGFDVEHNKTTFASSVYLCNTRFSKILNFIIGRHRTRIGLNCKRYWSPKFWSGVLEIFKSLKKIALWTVIKTFLKSLQVVDLELLFMYVLFVLELDACLYMQQMSRSLIRTKGHFCTASVLHEGSLLHNWSILHEDTFARLKMKK